MSDKKRNVRWVREQFKKQGYNYGAEGKCPVCKHEWQDGFRKHDAKCAWMRVAYGEGKAFG